MHVYQPRPTWALVLAAAVMLSPTACTVPGDANSAASGARVAKTDPSPAKAASPVPRGTSVRTAPSHGFNDDIAWRSLEDGLGEAAATQRPLMLVVHASWCSKCRMLKRTFRDPELVAMSEQFVMVNVDQDETPNVQGMGPDGTYLPRVLFLDPEGNIDASLQNPSRRRYRYFYMPNEDLLGTMQRALDRHGTKHERT